MDNKLSKPVFVKLSSLENGRDGYNVYVKVISVEISNNQEGKTPIAKAVVADDTASANAFFRGDNVKLIKVGGVLAIRNGKINYVKDHISLQIDIFGRITPQNVQIKPKTDFNISDQQIKRKPRRRNDQQRPRNYRNDQQRPRNYRNDQQRPRNHRNAQQRPRNYRNQGDRKPRQENQQTRHTRQDNDKKRDYDKPNRRDYDRPRENNERPHRQHQGENRGYDKGPRQERRHDYKDNKGQRKQPTKFTKIAGIEPGQDNLNLIARVVSAKQVGKKVRVVLGDETGIVNGFLYGNDAIKEGASIIIFKCQAKVVKQHIELQLMERGKVDEARKKVDQVNDEVNISAKEWVESS